MKSPSSGSTASPSLASCSEWRTISSNSLSDSGSRQPAIRTATKATPPISTAATITPSAMSSSARTAPIELNPWPTTSTTRPSDSAISAPKPTRRSWRRSPAEECTVTLAGYSSRASQPHDDKAEAFPAWPNENGGPRKSASSASFQCARDHEPLDLVRSLVNLGDLRVPHHPLDGVLLHVAVATQDLNR